ncbi:MAG: hypothetical protein ACPGSB_09540 [Opitutales bacterium]
MSRFRQVNPHSDHTQSKQPGSLRQFSDGKPETLSAYRRRRIVSVGYWIAPFLFLFLIVATGLVVSLVLATKEEKHTPDYAQTAFSNPSDELDVPDLIEAYLAATGGREALINMRSVLYEGVVALSPAEKDFQMLLKYPDKGMLVMDSDQSEAMKLMLNGDFGWQVIENKDGSREILPLSDEGTRSLQWSLRMHNTFTLMALESQFSGLEVRELQYEGKPCYEMTKTMPDGTEFLAILERETLYLLKTEESIDVSGSSILYTVEYADYRMVSGVVVPYRTKLYRNGEFENEVSVDSVRINTGVMSSLFEIPEQILDQ